MYFAEIFPGPENEEQVQTVLSWIGSPPSVDPVKLSSPSGPRTLGLSQIVQIPAQVEDKPFKLLFSTVGSFTSAEDPTQEPLAPPSLAPGVVVQYTDEMGSSIQWVERAESDMPDLVVNGERTGTVDTREIQLALEQNINIPDKYLSCL